MHFELFLTFDGVEYGIMGPHVKNPQTDNRVKYYQLENDWDDVDFFFDDNAIDEIAKRCDSLIGYGDADYFNAEKCKILKDWIDERLRKPAESRYREMLEVLKDYCQQAVELNTGVYIDL